MALYYKMFTIIKEMTFLLLCTQIRKEAAWSWIVKTAFEFFQVGPESHLAALFLWFSLCGTLRVFQHSEDLDLSWASTLSVHSKGECRVGRKPELDRVRTTMVFVKTEFDFKIWLLSRELDDKEQNRRGKSVPTRILTCILEAGLVCCLDYIGTIAIYLTLNCAKTFETCIDI